MTIAMIGRVLDASILGSQTLAVVHPRVLHQHS